MAKKKRKSPNLPAEALARARAELYGEEAPQPEIEEKASEGAKPSAKAATKAAAAAQSSRAVSVEDLKQEYIYVISDMQSMVLLAGALFVAMVIIAAVVV